MAGRLAGGWPSGCRLAGCWPCKWRGLLPAQPRCMHTLLDGSPHMRSAHAHAPASPPFKPLLPRNMCTPFSAWTWTPSTCPAACSPTSPSTTPRWAGSVAFGGAVALWCCCIWRCDVVWVCCVARRGPGLGCHMPCMCWAGQACLPRTPPTPTPPRSPPSPPSAPRPTQGMHASLELLPMWSGVDPDVELYASGVVVDDDGDFSGGQALNDGAVGRLGWEAGSGAAGQPCLGPAGRVVDGSML